jgi:hypothetical protein
MSYYTYFGKNLRRNDIEFHSIVGAATMKETNFDWYRDIDGSGACESTVQVGYVGDVASELLYWSECFLFFI